MTIPPEPTEDSRPPRSRRRKSRWSLKLTPGGVFVLLSIDLVLLAILAWPILRTRLQSPSTPIPAATTSSPAPSDTVQPSDTPLPGTPTPTISPTPSLAAPFPEEPSSLIDQGLIVLALSEGTHTHLFAYRPQSLPLMRLTGGPWDDQSPALSPDGQQVAFTSNRNGYWDLYTLDLSNGSLTRLTDSLTYESGPSWSPDGLWLAYEAYSEEDDGGLEIYIRPLQGDEEPVRLTEHPAADYAPAWSPAGRQIAFVSNRSGEPEIWMADLDKIGEDRFWNVSQKAAARESHPVWTADGNRLAWNANEDGFHNLVYRDIHPQNETTAPAVIAGSGDWPAWSPDGTILLTALEAPNSHHLAAFPISMPGIIYPPISLPGRVFGLSWGSAPVSFPSANAFRAAASITPSPLWQPVLTPAADIPGGRQHLVEVEGISAPYPLLHDMADEAFIALRENLSAVIGWDLFSNLENAYIPLTTQLDPGRSQDWLYTGRAFAFTTVPVNAGWMVVVREDFGAETYWRIFLRVRYQDGSAGVPLSQQPWDFSTRYTGSTAAYEQGGSLTETIPPGYWLDLTEFALSFGWKRLPALPSWRSSFPAARFNVLALTDGLDWHTAMLELYPSEALITATPLVPPTRTPTTTPRWYQSPTPTITPSPRPTLTPLPPTPTETVLPTLTATATRTSEPTESPQPTTTPSRTALPTSTPETTLTSSPTATGTNSEPNP